MHTDTRASGHSLQWTKALISKPAPHWEGTAVINGEMKELKLTDYKVTDKNLFLPAAEQVYKSFFFFFSFIFNLQIFLLMTRLCVSRGRQISRDL